jgi:amino acid permease
MHSPLDPCACRKTRLAVPGIPVNLRHGFVQVTYADVAEHALGAAGKMVVEVLVVVSQTGFCVAYVIFIHDTVPNLIPAVSPWMVMAIIVPVQVCFQPSVSYSFSAACIQ